MSYVVLDASFAYQLLLSDPAQTKYEAKVNEWRIEGFALVAPTLWIYELTSTLHKAVFFGALREDVARSALAHALQLDVALLIPDSSQTTAAFDWARRLRRASAYDCFYLALAESLGCELWTADQRLVNAAGQSWVRSAAQG